MNTMDSEAMLGLGMALLEPSLCKSHVCLAYQKDPDLRRIQKVEPSILDSNSPLVQIQETQRGSTFQIRPGGWVSIVAARLQVAVFFSA